MLLGRSKSLIQCKRVEIGLFISLTVSYDEHFTKSCNARKVLNVMSGSAYSVLQPNVILFCTDLFY